MSRIRGSSSTTRTRLRVIAASIAREGGFSRIFRNLEEPPESGRVPRKNRRPQGRRSASSGGSSGRGLAVAELDHEELLHLLLEDLQLDVGDDRIGDLRGLAVPGLLDA